MDATSVCSFRTALVCSSSSAELAAAAAARLLMAPPASAPDTEAETEVVEAAPLRALGRPRAGELVAPPRGVSARADFPLGLATEPAWWGGRMEQASHALCWAHTHTIKHASIRGKGSSSTAMLAPTHRVSAQWRLGHLLQGYGMPLPVAAGAVFATLIGVPPPPAAAAVLPLMLQLGLHGPCADPHAHVT